MREGLLRGVRESRLWMDREGVEEAASGCMVE